MQLAKNSPDVTAELAGWVDDLRELWNGPDGRDVLAGILTYLWVVSDTPEQRLMRLVAGLGVEAEEVAVTTAQKMRAEGRVELLIEQLTRKFGALSEVQLAAIRSGSAEQVTAWIARLIDGAESVVDVLA